MTKKAICAKCEKAYTHKEFRTYEIEGFTVVKCKTCIVEFVLKYARIQPVELDMFNQLRHEDETSDSYYSRQPKNILS